MCYFYRINSLTGLGTMNVYRSFLFLVLSLLVPRAIAQEIVLQSGKPEAQQADSLFNVGKYAQALPLMQELHNQYPKDYHYNYALGVCYINTSRRAELAIPYLSKASAGEVPNKVYFYLAEAYRKIYRFPQAIDYYRRFTVNGGSNDIKTSDVEKYVNLCENGDFLLKYIYSPQIVDKKLVSSNDFYEFYPILPKSVSFVQKPNDLKSSADQKQNESSIIIYPKNPQTGDYIYYSSYGKTTQYGKDIFRIKRLDDGYWSKPENLGDVINSSEDEDYPYMSPDGVTLYFASKGHYSMGGYDLYRSVFDPALKKWSTPENLGFPFSSPFDDILYLPDSNDSLACFATNRDCEGDSVQVCMFKVEKDPIRRSFTSVEEVQGIAKLITGKEKVVKQVVNKDEPQDRESNKVQVSKAKPASFNAVENDPEYIRVITKGFAKQKETDSLRVKLEKLRGKFEYINTTEERKVLEAKVVKVEDALLAAQNEADKMFALASQIEQEYLTGKRKPQGKVDSSFATDNPEYLYQAQFATTVFRSDEIIKLSQIEKLQNQINIAREDAVTAKAKYNTCSAENDTLNKDCGELFEEMQKKMNVYSSLISKIYDVKYKIYSDCIMVAIVKSGNNNGLDAKAEIERANSHFRSASAIKNNLGDEGKIESLFEASLLNEIGILRLELAFTRVWGMNLFEQQTTSRVIRLEKIAFGNPLPPVVNKEKKQEFSTDKVQPKEEVSISRIENKDISTDQILIKNDQPLTFQVVEKSPYDAQNPIPIDEAYPSGVVYKIQLGAYSKPLEISFFKGMVPVSGEKISGGKVTKYYIGKFKRLADAEKALPVVRSKGFKDAFINAWLNGKTIPITRAKTIEDKQPSDDTQSKKNNSSDTTSSVNKIYQIQIGKYDGRLPNDVSQTIKALATGKDIIRKPEEQGKIIYLIGSYSSIEEANRVKDNLVAGGISEAIVITLEVDKK